MKFSLFALITLAFLFSNSCVSPYEFNATFDEKILLVEGNLSNKDDEQLIFVRQSEPDGFGQTGLAIGLDDLQVEILVNNKESIKFTPLATRKGAYKAPKGFFAKPGNSYKLVIVKPTGEQYESSEEKLISVAPVSKVYQKINIIGAPGTAKYEATHSVFLDTKDPANETNFYQWSYALYESQDICRTCEPQERYYINNTTYKYPGTCVKDLPQFLRNVIYDYQCSGPCFEIKYSNKVNVLSDEASNGLTITAREIATIPFYQANAGALFVIKQRGISPQAYRYFKTLVDQNQNSGGLADTPPAPLIGNIKNVKDPQQIVTGYFTVAAESEYRYWLDRSDTQNLGLNPIGLLERKVNLEVPSAADPTRPPFAPCIESYTRTQTKPIGWKN